MRRRWSARCSHPAAGQIGLFYVRLAAIDLYVSVQETLQTLPLKEGDRVCRTGLGPRAGANDSNKPAPTTSTTANQQCGKHPNGFQIAANIR